MPLLAMQYHVTTTIISSNTIVQLYIKVVTVIIEDVQSVGQFSSDTCLLHDYINGGCFKIPNFVKTFVVIVVVLYMYFVCVMYT